MRSYSEYATRVTAVVKPFLLPACIIWAAALAALIATTYPALAAGYRVVDLTPASALAATGAAASGGVQGGDFTIGYYRVRCGARKICSTDQTQASIWSGRASNIVDLDPQGYFTSTVTGLSGGRDVGYGLATQPVAPNYLGYAHGLTWLGSAASMVDLHPPQYRASHAYGTDGTVEVGSGDAVGASVQTHALMWFGSTASVVDLNAPALDYSVAYAVAHGREVGAGGIKTFYGEHAYLWRGSAASGIDLNPAGYSTSRIVGLDGNVEVGEAVPAGLDDQAYLWTGSSNKGVDLNPVNCRVSIAQGVRGGKQIGFGSCNGNVNSHALSWSGTAASYVDLHRFLPSGYNQSWAYGIDADGTIVGVAVDSSYKTHAILWIPQTNRIR